MNGWLIKTAGIVMVTAIAEILLPSGKTKNACRTVMALLTVAVMISPLADIAGFEFDFKNAFPAADEIYVDTTAEYYCNLSEKEVKNLLEKEGYVCPECEIEGVFDRGKFITQKVCVKIKNTVISGEDEHIIDTVKITEMLASALDLPKEKVFVYGE